MRVRLLKKSDIKEVAKLFVAAYKKDEKARRWDVSLAEEYVLLLYRIGKDLCFVALDNEKIVGVELAMILPDFNKKVVVSKVLLVHPDYRRKKIGTKLLRKLCIKAENKYEIREIETNVYTLTNFPITWYERIGFRTKAHYEITKAKISKILGST